MSCKACQLAAQRRDETHREQANCCTQERARPPRYGIAVVDRPGHQIVQRKCSGGCERHGSPGIPLVSGPGAPLDPRTLRFFETRMGQDFSGVRIHNDSSAMAAARGIGARAFTMGSHISFGSGEYRPSDQPGRRLLAHELAHVVQQGATRPNSPPASMQAASESTVVDCESEADHVADRVVAGGNISPSLHVGTTVQRQPLSGSLFGDDYHLRPPDIPPPPLLRPGSIREAWVVPNPPALPELEVPEPPAPLRPRRQPLAQFPPLTLDPAMRFTPVTIIPVPRCVPDRPLTWADFPGRRVPGGFSAVTRVVTPQITVDGNPMFQARLRDQPASAVLPSIIGLSARATNGCARIVGQCQRFMRANPGRPWTTSRPVPDRCPAVGISINTATSFDECESIVGVGCDADAVQESARLLAHEQLHFDIPCTLVGRANDALIAGTHSPAQLAPWLRDNVRAQQRQYETESGNGCIAAGQATWVTKVANGLPAVALPRVRSP